MILSLFNDENSESHYQRFLQEKVLARLRGLEERALRDGLERLDPASDILIPVGMEVDPGGRVTKDCYGVFNLSWQAESNPEWPDQVEQEVSELRRRIQERHGASLRFLI